MGLPSVYLGKPVGRQVALETLTLYYRTCLTETQVSSHVVIPVF